MACEPAPAESIFTHAPAMRKNVPGALSGELALNRCRSSSDEFPQARRAIPAGSRIPALISRCDRRGIPLKGFLYGFFYSLNIPQQSLSGERTSHQLANDPIIFRLYCFNGKQSIYELMPA